MRRLFLSALATSLASCSSGSDDASASGGAMNLGGTAGSAGGGASGAGGMGAISGAGAMTAAGSGPGGGGGASGSGGAPTKAGIIEKGPPCEPDGPTAAELGSAIERLFVSPGLPVESVEAAPSGIYFSVGEGDLYLVEPGTTTFRVVVPDADVGYSNSPGADGLVRVNGTHVYWASDAGIQRAVIGTWAPETVVENVPSIDFIQIDAENVYFSVREDDLIAKAPLAGGPVTELSRGDFSLQDLKVAEGFVYASDFSSDRVGRVPVAGGAVEWITGMLWGVHGVLPVGPTIYFADSDGLKSNPIANPAGEVLFGYVLDQNNSNLVLKGDRIYWNDNDNNIGWTKIDGSECDVLVREVGSEFAVDDTHVYVARGNTLARFPLVLR